MLSGPRSRRPQPRTLHDVLFLGYRTRDLHRQRHETRPLGREALGHPVALHQASEGQGQLSFRSSRATSVTAACARGILGGRDADRCGHLSGLCCGLKMPQARRVFADQALDQRRVSGALCCRTGVPIPSHGRCARPLLALLRSDALATVVSDAVTARARYLSLPHQRPHDPGRSRRGSDRGRRTARCSRAPRGPASAACAAAGAQASCPAGRRRGPAA